MKKYLYITLLMALPILLVSASMSDFPGVLQKYLSTYNSKLPQEKVYIQTDKTFYKPSETIYLKTFLVNANNNKMSTTSDIIYIELRDPWGNVVQKREAGTQDGCSNSAFTLAADVAGGLYKLVAYTNWMKNFGESNYFTKDITVQKVITPRLLLKIDFRKRAYGAGDEVVADLKVTDLNNQKTNNSTVKSTVRIGGLPVHTLESTTEHGESVIAFNLPKDLSTSDGILQIVVSDKGTEESITRSIPIVLNKIDIKFYPEGGDMVQDVRSKVAFEAQDEFKKGADVSGNIFDDQGTLIAQFESFHLGMGAFEFTPKAGRKYFAKLNKPQGIEMTIPLPEAQKKGYALNLKSKDENALQWSIYSPKNGTATLVAHTQGDIKYNKAIKLSKGSNTVEVPTADFPMGIAVFTLFDTGNKEVCERLIFVNADRGLNISLESKDTFMPEENVQLKIKTTDKNGKPVSANLGLSVVDEQLLTFADDKQDNILSYMLFSSELQGKIQEPYFYFDPKEPKAKEATDYLMLTHGWRRFTWDDVLNKQDDINIQYYPEKLSSIYGYVLNNNGEPTQAEVYLIETDGKRRVIQVKTTSKGYFVFHNIDVSCGIYITTKLPNQVYLLKESPIKVTNKGFVLAPLPADSRENEETVITELQPATPPVPPAIPRRDMKQELDDIDMFDQKFSSEALLDEVVVVGYGTQRKADVTGSISVVREEKILVSNVSVESALAGRIAGLYITPANVNPGPNQNISIRGTTSTMAGGEPLVVIDGLPASGSTAQAFSFLDPNDIQNITVLKNSSATAIYGSRGANGVILIETKKTRFSQRGKEEKPNYGGVYVPKREFYATPDEKEFRNNDKDRSTVYWNGNIKTDKDGNANIRFRNNAQSSTFRITAEGLAPINGLIGGGTKQIVTRKPLSVDTKIPLFAGSADLIKIPVMVRNNTDKPMVSNVKMVLPENLYFDKSENQPLGKEKLKNVIIESNQVKTIYYSIRAGNNIGESSINISVNSDKYSDAISSKLTVRQINFPYYFYFSGKNAGQTQTVDISEVIPGTLTAEAVSYSEMLDQLFDGVESIFREPYGCFEQLSSSTFPNIFAMQLLKATSQDKPEVYDRALKYLEIGYNKLAAYEVKKTGGFEWYGGSPAHEVLSAYGLVEFYEMGKVYNKVDKAMLDRTLNFILSRRDGKGGFKQNSGKYGFSAAPKNVNNAYIVYALTETGYADKVDMEYRSALKEALTSKDMYRMSLMANAAYNIGDNQSYMNLVQRFKEHTLKGDFDKMPIEATIVRSYGDASNREAVAFWMLALMKQTDNQDLILLDKCLEYINKGRRNGSFGNTQATSICLQALTKYAEIMHTDITGGQFCITTNGAEICKDLTKSKSIIRFQENLKEGKNSIKVQYKGIAEKYNPYAVTVSWQSVKPATSALCPLRLTTQLAQKDVKVNETVRLNVRLENTKNNGQPMSVAIIGIPGGLSLQPWQLKELQEREVFDFYEIINDNLVIYYRELGPAEVKAIDLDLKAETPGHYKGIASSAYIYYMNEHKYWLDGIAVNIGE